MEWKHQREAIIGGLILSLLAPSFAGFAEEMPSATETDKPPASTEKKTEAAGDPKADSTDGKKAADPETDADGQTASVRVRELKPGEKPAKPAAKTPAKKPAARVRPRRPSPPPKPKKKDLAKVLGPLPSKRVAMDFRGMDIDNVLLMFSTWAGKTILKDPGLTGPVNLIQGKEIPLLDAFKILEAVLNQKGFTLDKDGPVLKVVPKPPDNAPASSAKPPEPPKPAEPPKPDDDKITRIFQLQYASAQTVARIVNELFGSAGGGQPQPGQPGGPPPGQPGGPPPGQPGAPPGSGKPASKKVAQVKATADFDTNKVLVTGDEIVMDDVKKVIDELDKKQDIPLETRSWELQFAEVNDVATQVAAVLASISGTGRGSPFQNIPFEQRVLGGGGGGYNPFGGQNTGPTTAAGGHVISDPRTNTLTVIATPEQLAKVDEVVKALDKKVEYASTTFILPLKHVEATEAAFVLSQLFQRQQNNNDFPFFFFGGGGNNRNNQIRQRRRIGDPQSTRPPVGARQNNNPFGFSSFDGSNAETNDGTASAASSARSDDSIMRDRQPNPQLNAPGVALGDQGGGQTDSFPVTSVTLDGAQLAQWWDSYGSRDNSPKTGRDESGRVRPLVDLQGKITIVPNLNTNALIVNTNPSNLQALRDVIALIDKSPAQVLIEAVIVEASLDENTKLGFTLNWIESPAFGSNGTSQRTQVNLPVADAVGGITTTVLGHSFDAILQAVKTDRRFKILSTPRIFTQNNRQAAIAIGQDVPIPKAGTSFGSTSQEVDFKNVGVVLDVTPHITADGYVNIEVGQDANDIAGFTKIFDSQIPIINRRTTETTVSMRDGQTVVLGGLIRDSVQNSRTKVPILGDLPVVGSLFRSKDRAASRTQLMVFLRSQIVQYDDELDDLTNRQGREAGIDPDSPAGRRLRLRDPDANAPKDLPKRDGQGGLPPVTDGPL